MSCVQFLMEWSLDDSLTQESSTFKIVIHSDLYHEIFSKMIEEIHEREAISGTDLDTLDSTGTLPSIYNVMAMAARRLREKGGALREISCYVHIGLWRKIFVS